MKTNQLFPYFPAAIIPIGKQLPKPNRLARVIITIPAKNEAENIWKTLSALSIQSSGNKLISPHLFEVLVLCNHCTDNTEESCDLFQKLHSDFPLYIFKTHHPTINNVGIVRKILMDTASKRISEDGLIIMTDADTLADANWLDAYLNLQSELVDLICGIIKPDLKRVHIDTKRKLFHNRKYLNLVSKLESELLPQEYDPWPRHSHNSGPNMAIKNSVYKKVGGIPPLACFEDIALYQKVISEGYKVLHSSKPKVTTSCRSSSRVPGGFGTQIKNWSSSKKENVEGLEKLSERFKAYAEIRAYYEQPQFDSLTSICSRLKFEISDLKSIIQNHPRSSSMIIFLENHLKFHEPWNFTYPNKPIDLAIKELDNYFSSFSHTNSSYKSSRTSVDNLKQRE